MKVKIAIAAAFLAILSSCIPSVYPLYSPDTIVKEPLLNGTWISEDSDTWEFTAQQDHSYRLVYTANGQAATLEANLVKLNDQYYMDFYPVSVAANKDALFNKGFFGDLEKNGFYFIHFFPVHTFAKVDVKGDQIGIRLFNPDFLDDLFEQRKVRIRHETGKDGNTLLTASTRDLQKFIIKYGNEQKAFDEDALELIKSAKANN